MTLLEQIFYQDETFFSNIYKEFEKVELGKTGQD